MGRTRGTPITIRLVKGAYWDYEVLTARRLGWPEPVFLQKWQSDAMYERCSMFLIVHHDKLRPAFGSHNIRSLAHAIAAAEMAEIPPAGFELQTLHGMGDVIQAALVARGQRVRVYTPYGAMLPGMAYLVRRLLENTSNESFLKASSVKNVQIDNLLRNPREVGAMVSRTMRTIPQSSARSAELAPFRNEPVTDFAIAENRQAMSRAIEAVRSRLGQTYPLLIAGREIRGDLELLDALDPSRSSRIVSRTAAATAEHARQAVAAARSALPTWAATHARDRAEVLLKAAAIMRQRRFELAAWEIFECAQARARPMPMSPRLSIFASFTPGKWSGWLTPDAAMSPARPTPASTFRAVSPWSFRPGTSPWPFPAG